MEHFIGGKSVAELVRLFSWLTVHDNGDVIAHEYAPTWESHGYVSDGDTLRLGCIKDRYGDRIGAQIRLPINLIADIIAVGTVWYNETMQALFDDNCGIAELNPTGVAVATVINSYLEI